MDVRIGLNAYARDRDTIVYSLYRKNIVRRRSGGDISKADVESETCPISFAPVSIQVAKMTGLSWRNANC